MSELIYVGTVYLIANSREIIGDIVGDYCETESFACLRFRRYPLTLGCALNFATSISAMRGMSY